jgi:hypothetical protein
MLSRLGALLHALSRPDIQENDALMTIISELSPPDCHWLHSLVAASGVQQKVFRPSDAATPIKASTRQGDDRRAHKTRLRNATPFNHRDTKNLDNKTIHPQHKPGAH